MAFKDWIEGNQPELESQADPDRFKKEYELAIRIGHLRFGSECKHKHIHNGICTWCLRKVIK